ncbi:hypothetical protein LQE93_15620 [Clostridium sp. NSJ-145]|uniref:hypothetical protein n=1 Tax=Clostridium sp. NSJ-145 TaxID=2897777 RepID=UPI001E2FC1C6|nr:hypothetical protein [Clostridium sp. NSJ-145]MCD2503189.1 hypothetical protein [Clostridium sp. NSJ-145]
MEENNIFRLAALLYKDSNYNVKKDNTLKKVIESLFIDNNIEITIFEAIELCEKKYNLHVIEEEIRRIIEREHNIFQIINKGNGNIKFKLLEKRYKIINSDNIIGIDKFINEFCIDKSLENNKVKTVIYRFLYDIFTTNLNSYEYYIKNEALAKDFSVDSSKYEEDEVKLINSFLSYDNKDKDKAIFNIVSLSLEYCVLTGNGKQLYPEGLRNKIFFLDTNIIYRAIGINGDERKALTLKFLNKCNEIGIGLNISVYSEEEFNKSLEFYIKNINKYQFSNINKKLYEKYQKGKDIYNNYLEWKSGRVDYGIEKYQAFIKANYESFKRAYKINVDYKLKITFNENNKKRIDELSQSIMILKSDIHISSSIIDASNILLLDNLRKETHSNISKLLEVKYFLISTDQKLREWDLLNVNNEQPIVFLPSQWLAIILRFVSATSDDFKSFVSFLNIKKADEGINKEKLLSVLEGISEITEDIERQEFYADEIIEQKANDIINNSDIECIKKETKEYVKASMDQLIVDAQTEVAATKQKIEITENEMKSIKKQKDNYGQVLNNIIMLAVDSEMKKWRMQILWFIPIVIVSVIFLLQHIIMKNSQYNLVTYLYKLAGDDNASLWIVQVISGGCGLTLSCWALKQCWNRINTKSSQYNKKKQFIEKKYKSNSLNELEK